jgi:uncharacterized protein YndB with AHSA1/START domain
MTSLETIVSTPTDRAILVTREFEAPRQLVWNAFTDPDIVQRWLGLNFGGWQWESCEMDLREGGAWRWVWAQPDGPQIALSGVFRTVTPTEQIVMTQVYEGMDAFGEMVVTMRFIDLGTRTRLEETIEYPSTEARDADLQQAPEGMKPGFENLDRLLATLTRG